MNFLFKDRREESKGQLYKSELLQTHALVIQISLFQCMTAVAAKTLRSVASMKSNDE